MSSKIKMISCFLLCLNVNLLVAEAGLFPKGLITTNIPFTGVANGGELFLCDTLNRNATYVKISTSPKESAESVASRLAAVINQSDPFSWHFTRGTEVVHSFKGTLVGLPCGIGTYILSGTEDGLGIPEPPTSLTASYAESSKLVLHWRNPPEEYNQIVIVFNWSNYDIRSASLLEGKNTEYVLDMAEHMVDLNDLDIWLIGYRNGIPSNAAAIHVSNNVQEELFGIPSFKNITPNWIKWSKENRISFSQKTKTQKVSVRGKTFNPVKNVEDKPFYQVIQTDPKGSIGGVSRTFIGLPSNHKYRVTVRFAIKNLNASDIISIDASYNDSNELTVDQMAGISRLPNGSIGVQRGALVLCDVNHVQPQDQFISRSTEVALPNGIHNLTVWLRCDVKSSTKVSLDWLSLEDLSL